MTMVSCTNLHINHYDYEIYMQNHFDKESYGWNKNAHDHTGRWSLPHRLMVCGSIVGTSYSTINFDHWINPEIDSCG